MKYKTFNNQFSLIRDDNIQQALKTSSDTGNIEKEIARYGLDYTRWSDSMYTPDDEATREEIEVSEKAKEQVEIAQFES